MKHTRLNSFICNPCHAAVLLALLTFGQPVQATVTNVSAGTNVNTLTPANGDVWNLLGNAYLSNGSDSFLTKSLPSGTSGLTLNGNDNILTLNDGSGHTGSFRSASDASITLSDITLSGGSNKISNSRSGKSYLEGGAIGVTAGALTLNTAGMVSFNNNSMTSTGATIADGGAVSASGTLTINGAGSTLIFNNNSITSASKVTANGGAIYAGGDATMTADSLQLTHNTSSYAAAGLYTGGKLTIDGSLLATNNRAMATGASVNDVARGGAIYAANGVSVSGSVDMQNNSVGVNDGQVRGNVEGGAIAAVNGAVSLATQSGDVTLKNNRADGMGGAIWAYTNAVTLGNAGSTIKITGNNSLGTGGAINAGAVTITGHDIQLANNTSIMGGGAIYGTGGDVNILSNGNISITGNQSGNDNSIYGGGAISLYSGNQLNIGGTGATIDVSNNVSVIGHGGAIYGFNNAITFNGTTTLIGNQAGLNGGAIYATGGGSVLINGSLIAQNNTSGTATLSTSTSYVGDGGVIATTNTASTGSSIIVTQGVMLDNNTAIGIATSNGGGVGGALAGQYNTGTGIGKIQLATQSGDVTLTNNVATRAGGALSMSGSSSSGVATTLIQIGNGTGKIDIEHNYAGYYRNGADLTLANWSGAQLGVGGAVYSVGAVAMNGTDITLSDNHAQATGGGIQSLSSVTLTGNQTTADGNIAGTSGGAIYAVTGVTVNGNVTMTHNAAQGGVGGAIANFNSGSISLAQSNGHVTLTNNTAAGTGSNQSGSGGALHAKGSANVLIGNSASAVTITGNKAGYSNDGTVQAGLNDGGAMNTASGAVTINGQTINVSGNLATGNGGAIYTQTGAVNLTGNATLNNNLAFGGTGGAIRSGSTVTLTADSSTGSLSLTGNVASGNGGAIAAETGSTTLSGHSINLAGNYAGYQLNNSTPTSVSTTADGGAIKSQAVTLTGATNLSDNHATRNGGAIYATGNLAITANADASINGNTAGGQGGAIWAGSNVTLNANGGDMTFSGNQQAGSAANAIWLENTGKNAKATFNVATGRSLYFYDPIQNNAANSLISVIKSGDGLLSFDGSQHSSDADRWSQIYGNTSVQGGTFEVANNAVYGVRAADIGRSTNTSFNMSDNTTLQGGVMGTVRADTVNFGNNVTLNIAGRQPNTRGVFEVASSNLTLGNNNRILFNTYLNDGVVQNTDLLRLNGATVNGSADLIVANAGGSGAVTVGNGIMLVNVTNGATTSDSTFHLGNRVAVGAFEYDLYHGGVGADAQNGHWYLRSIDTSPPAPPAPPTPPTPPAPPSPDPAPNPNPEPTPTPTPDPVPPPTPEPQPTPQPQPTPGPQSIPDPQSNSQWVPDTPSVPHPSPRPETGVYLTNMAAAQGMFVHTLHDRLGEPQYTEAYRQEDQGKVTAVWARVVGSHSDGKAAGGVLDTNTDTTLIHLGGDIARWRDDNNQRYHLGIMGAVGNARTKASSVDITTTSSGAQRVADGTVEGYSVGVYGTWYQHDPKDHIFPRGPYIDTWAQYGWYNNTVKGNQMDGEKYKSNGLLASIEGGWAFMMNESKDTQWMIEPQAQFVYSLYNQDDHQEGNGTQVSDGTSNGYLTRLGARLFTRDLRQVNGLQPFVEANWWHSNIKNKLSFNDVSIDDGTPSNRYEIKIGMQGEFAKRWQIWSHVGMQMGQNDYRRYEGQIGIKHLF